MCESIVDNNEYEELPTDILIDESYTLSYCFEDVVKRWISFHSYIPDLIFSLRNNQVLSFYNNTLYLHNADSNYCKFYDDVIYESYITPVLSPNMKEDESTRSFPILLENISMNIDIENQEGVRQLQNFITAISLHNSYQSSVKINFVPYNNECSHVENYRNYNVKRVKNRWEFNRFKDNIIVNTDRGYSENISDFIERNVFNSFCEKDYKPFIDDYVIAKLYYDNKSQQRMVIRDINFTFRLVRI